jgi:hypothetical protein
LWLAFFAGGGLDAIASAQAVSGAIDWQFHDTDHFEVVYARGVDVDLDRLGPDIERVYRQVSSDLGHELPFTPMLVLFSTRSELDRVTRSGLLLPAREHIALSLDGPWEGFTGELAHQLTHTVLFDMLPRAVVNDLPLWFSEGVAEHERGVWEEGDLDPLREVARKGPVPRISSLAPISLPEDPLFSRVLGHAAFDFIASRWGKQGVREYLAALRQRVTIEGVYRKAFGITPDEFDRDFSEYLRKRF